MEDPGEEWDYEEFNDSPVESRKSSLSWLWSKGLWLGEKVLVTSFVISCAPLVLPPLVVVSALGFAVSIPAGVVIASYTCMEKLMNKLLPAPASPSTMLEEEDGSVEQIAEAEKEEDGSVEQIAEAEKEEDGIVEQIAGAEKEEDGSVEQIAEAEKEQGVVSADTCINSTTDIGEVEEIEVSPAASLDKKSYAEDAGEYNGVEKIESHEIPHPKIEDFGEEEVKEPPKKETNSPIEVKDVGTLVQEDTKSADTKKLAVAVMVSREAQGTAGNAAEVKIPEGTTGVLKKTRDDGISHETSKKKNKKQIKSSCLKTSHGVEGKKEYKTVTSTKETGKAIEVGDEKLKMVDPNGLKADHNGVKGEKTTVQVENSVPTLEMKSVILESSVGEDRSTTKGDEKPIRYQSVSAIASQAGEDHHNVDENVKLGMGNKGTMKEIRIEDSAANDNFDKQRAIPSDTKAKGTTGNINVDKRRADSATGVPKDPVEKGLKTSKQDSGVHKALLNEKKLWDLVDALRLIVGYKAAMQPSLIEELKALYVFTGVEPPSSFQDSDDICGTEDMLHFLMSVVGIK